MNQKENVEIDLLWRQLRQVRELQLTYHSHCGLQRKGRGNVLVEEDSMGRLIFHEKGTWESNEAFYNTYRWTKTKDGTVSLEHLRLGINRPVFLLTLAPVGDFSLASTEAHACAQDQYSAHLTIHPSNLILTWTIAGPGKSAEIVALYY